MNSQDYATPFSIYFIIPIIGIGLYFILSKTLLDRGATTAFLAEILFLFICYGGWLLVILTGVFWEWSGLASAGTLFLIFISPLAMLGCAIHLFITRKSSRAHLLAFFAASFYIPLIFFAIGSASMIG